MYAPASAYLNFEPDPVAISIPDSYHRARLMDARLMELKRRLDPANMFRVNHTISPG
jgi:hypothetical protein